MMTRYTAKAGFLTSLFGGPEVEFDVWITFLVEPGCPAVLYGDYPSPAEAATVEIISVEAHDPKAGVNHKLPDFMADAITDKDSIREWLLIEAAECDAYAADVAADHRREAMRDDARAA